MTVSINFRLLALLLAVVAGVLFGLLVAIGAPMARAIHLTQRFEELLEKYPQFKPQEDE